MAPVQQPEVNRLVAGLLLVTRAVLLLDGLQMLLVPVVLHRHLWNQLAGLLLASSSVQTRLALNRMRVAQECLLQPAALALLQPAVVDLRGHRLLRHPCNHLSLASRAVRTRIASTRLRGGQNWLRK